MNLSQYLLPRSTRLVHIGPHKTGTSTIQSAFHASRPVLADYGVHYAGRSAQPVAAALAVSGGPGGRWQADPDPEDWTRLVEEIRDAGDQRVVVSSEFFCHADDAAARRVVSEITGGPVHVVITLRPLVKILPSQWQQYVQNGLRLSYDQWLVRMFRDLATGAPKSLLWHRHHHGQLVRRWSEAAGRENVTVVVSEGSEPDLLPRVFESFVGLPQGVLSPQMGKTNRSLTYGEVETLRRVVQHFHDQGWTGAWSNDVFGETIHGGAAQQMRTRRPGPDEARVATPEWAQRRAVEIGTESAKTIASLGVRVIGDLDAVAGTVSPPFAESADTVESIPADAAARAVLGAITGRGKAAGGARTAAMLPLLGTAPTRHTDSDGTEMAYLPVDTAARMIIGAIEGRDILNGTTRTPPISAKAASAAVLAGMRAGATTHDADPAMLLQVAESLGAPPAPRRQAESEQANKALANGARPARDTRPAEAQRIRELTSKELLGVLSRRGRRSIRRRMRRILG